MLLRSSEPLLVLSDSAVAPRRKDGTYGLSPPLLPETIEVFAPLSPTCLLISTPRTTTACTRASPAKSPPRRT
ncbi:hypothetical protein ACFYXC_40840 [Streptomyces sp. NPDC002701]|uniref:hypothetical protein n=1 Tax=Streptomyces sp. NPDC002701 TaxID=3364661 RepID=UPI0036966F79